MTIDEAKEIIEEVLSADEYHEQRTEIPSWIARALKWIKELVDKVVDWLIEMLEKLLNALDLSGGDGSDVSILSIIAFIIIAILAVGLLTVIVLLVLKLLKRSNTRKLKADADAEELVKLAEAPDESLRLYSENLEKGDFREAYRYLFISWLIQLNTRELIRIKIYKTNRVYRREILDTGAFDEKLTEGFFTLFNYTRFGGRSITEGELQTKYEEYLTLVAQADEAVKALRKKGGKA